MDTGHRGQHIPDSTAVFLAQLIACDFLSIAPQSQDTTRDWDSGTSLKTDDNVVVFPAEDPPPRGLSG